VVEEEAEVTALEEIPGLDSATLEVLKKAGLNNIEDIINKSVEALAAIEGMSAETAAKIINTISEKVEIVEEKVIKTEEREAKGEESEEVEYYECPNCGSPITESMVKCPSCGVELEFQEEAEEETGKGS
jgi:N utilization substance protein A